MINFSRSNSLSGFESSNEISKNFLDLNPTQKKMLIKKLSSSDRKIIVEIVKNNNLELQKNKIFEFKKIINEVKCLTIEITRKDDSRSKIANLKKLAARFIEQAAYLCNFLTANKTYKLIQSEIFHSGKKKSDLPIISKEKLIELLEIERSEIAGNKVDLANILKKNQYSNEIRNIEFSNEFSLSNLTLHNIEFVNCKFDWTSCREADLSQVVFKNCDIYNLSLINSNLEKCTFDHCEMREVMFTGAKLNEVVFRSSSLISCSFEDANLDHCQFNYASLPGSHFFEANIKDSSIENSQLKDTVFFNTFDQFSIDDESKKTAIVTRPTTAILIHPENRGIATPKAYMKLDQNADTIPIRITMQPAKVTKKGVNEEVETVLNKIGSYDKNLPPIPQRLITALVENEQSECARILKKAQFLASQVDSILLPGGEDIPPALYGKIQEKETDWGGDYRRSILELGLIHQSFTKGIPLMAICRGFQMSNVYFGAQLIQHVEGHKDIQKFELSRLDKSGLYAAAMKKNIMSVCFHHQGVSEDSAPTERLETSVVYDKLVKASELKESGTAPMILLQFHPEFYQAKTADDIIKELIDRGLNIMMSKENERFWDLLSDSAKAHRTKRVALQLILSSPPIQKKDASMIEKSNLLKRKRKSQYHRKRKYSRCTLKVNGMFHNRNLQYL